MEIDALVTQTLNEISGALLEKSRFGRSGKPLFWIAERGLKAASQALRDRCALDVLENLSAMQVDESLVFTYFLRDSRTGASAILRASAELEKPDRAIAFSSVTEIWPMAARFEEEIRNLFGVSFDGRSVDKTGEVRRGVWDSFPLRKSTLVGGGIAP